MSSSASLVAAWQDALAAEHEAAFGYTLLGPHLTGQQRALAVDYSNLHDRLRDTIEAQMTQLGIVPVSPQADYPALYPVPDAARARRVAARLEQNCASGWRFLYARAAASTGAQADARRTEAQSELTASALRATRWLLLIDPNNATTAFPGIDA